MQLQAFAQFRQSGQADQRRRRALADSLASGESGPAAGGALESGLGARAEQRSLHYGDAAFMDREMRLTDLIPRRLMGYLLILAAGLGVIAGIEGLYAWMPRLASYGTGGRVAAFDLASPGSLCAWFSSLTLQLAGMAAVLVYMIRRHRVDDYQGQYRIWLWAALCWFIISADVGAQLHHGFQEMMILVTGMRFFGDGAIWWVIPYFFLLGAVGLRLLLDMRECLLSAALLTLVAASYAFSVVVQLNLIAIEGPARQQMLAAGTQMLGNLLALLTMMLHARHVILDAEGHLSRPERPVVVRRPGREPLATEESDDEEEEDEEEAEQPAAALPVVKRPEWKSVDAAHPMPQPAIVRSPTAQPARAIIPGPSLPASRSPSPIPLPSPAAGASESQSGHQKLTKAERKALHKRLEDLRRQREGR